MRTQLLATFTTKEHLDDTVDSIQEAYSIVFNKIYVLQNENNTDELICTYNVDTKEAVDYNKVKGTISSRLSFVVNVANNCVFILFPNQIQVDFYLIQIPLQNYL